jgi:probable HAF family extracellular repeat protein
MTGRQIMHALLVTGLMSWVSGQSEAQQYNLKALGAGPPGPVWYINPRINNAGQVIGNRNSGGYLYSGGVSRALPKGTYALDINNNGAIAMQIDPDSYISVPPYSTQTDMGRWQACVVGQTYATGLNDSGTAVGIHNANTSCPVPFFYHNGQMTALGTSSRPQWLAINNSNQIVGYVGNYPHRAVELINGTLTDLDPANATAYDSEAMAINDAGQFIVNSDAAYCTKRLGPPSYKTITYVCRGTWYPLLYSGNTITSLGSLGPSGATATGINRWGDVVGTSQTSAGSSHGFLYIGGSMTDINSFTILNASGWTIQQGYDINDVGQMVALAADSNGKLDVVVLSPAPAPIPSIVSLTLNPTTVVGGIVGTGMSTGTVTISSPAPAGGVIVSVGSSNPVAQVPNLIRVTQGYTTATFTITTTATMGSVNVTISVTNDVSTKTATLTVTDAGS